MNITRSELRSLVLECLNEETEYQKFFRSALKKFGVNSPNEFKTDDEKDKFFTWVERNWTKEDPKNDDRDVTDEELEFPSFSSGRTGDGILTKRRKQILAKETIQTIRDMIEEELKILDERKVYNIQHNVGKAKYVVNFHDGKKTHNDGSPFYDIKTFKNKEALKTFVSELSRKGYKEGKIDEELKFINFADKDINGYKSNKAKRHLKKETLEPVSPARGNPLKRVKAKKRDQLLATEVRNMVREELNSYLNKSE